MEKDTGSALEKLTLFAGVGVGILAYRVERQIAVGGQQVICPLLKNEQAPAGHPIRSAKTTIRLSFFP